MSDVHHPASCVIRPLDVNDVDVEGEDDQVGGEDDEEEGESGERKVQKMNSPGKPSAAEIEEHNLTHLPYRNWCRHCVRGRGKEAAHMEGKRDGGNYRNCTSTIVSQERKRRGRI
jgi:hypothetical protein